ncbi:MAG TPA: type II toxin-antitoxin system VapC family toxin [Terriglobales bacterium]|nr:type II toxin-antitoxin system VapC family toxin [Terriglobales bacterium]
MILDASALIAILWDEPEAADFVQAISGADCCRISAVNFVEAAIVAERNPNPAGLRNFDTFLRSAGIVVAAVTEDQAHVARQAFVDFGKGRHAARLNLGDCFAYALSKVTGEPLLFKGEDFRKTDVKAAR